jgi:hypothetical protein
MVLSSARGLKAQVIAEQLHCRDEAVRGRFRLFTVKGWRA